MFFSLVNSLGALRFSSDQKKPQIDINLLSEILEIIEVDSSKVLALVLEFLIDLRLDNRDNICISFILSINLE